MIKKILSCITALCIVGTLSCAVYAYDNNEPTPVSNSEYDIMPLYDNVMFVSAGISLNSSNKAVCTGTYTLYDKYKSKITMTLMKSSDGVSKWSAVESWSQTNTAQNSAGYSKTSTNTLSSSYYYRTYVQVQIYDSNNKIIETVTCFSNPCHL